MQKLNLSLTSNGEVLGEVDVKRGIFQGDSLSPLLFVLSMIPLSFILRKVNICYEWGILLPSCYLKMQMRGDFTFWAFFS